MIQHIKQKIKQNNGFTGQDILIALFILMLFLSAFTTIMVNLSSTSKEIEDVKKITEKITQIADKIDALEFDAIENQLEDEEITKLIGEDGNIGSDKLKVFYTANGDDDLKTINLKVKRLNSKNEIPKENVFEMKLSKQAVTIESDTGDGSGSGDGSGDGSGTGTETKPIESLEHTTSKETTIREDITKQKVTYINGLNWTDGTSASVSVPTGSIAVIWSNTSNTVNKVAGNRFSFWVGYKVKKDRR